MPKNIRRQTNKWEGQTIGEIKIAEESSSKLKIKLASWWSVPAASRVLQFLEEGLREEANGVWIIKGYEQVSESHQWVYAWWNIDESCAFPRCCTSHLQSCEMLYFRKRAYCFDWAKRLWQKIYHFIGLYFGSIEPQDDWAEKKLWQKLI